MPQKPGIRISEKDLRDLNREIIDAVDDSMDETYTYFKKITPVRSGNARRNTRYSKNKHRITADYAYGARLDDGWSKQAPRGMTEPSLQYLIGALGRHFAKI